MTARISITCKVPGMSPELNHLNSHGNPLGLSVMTPRPPLHKVHRRQPRP